jgi:hypothetical protein
MAHKIGAMPASIEEDAEISVLAAHDDDRLHADLPPDIIAVVRNFAFVPEIDPHLAKNVVHLPLEQYGIVIEASVNAIREDQLANVDV